MSTVVTRLGVAAFQRAREYTSWVDVARLEERVAQAFRRLPQRALVTAIAPERLQAGDGDVVALVSGSGAVDITAERPGQVLTVRSMTGTLTVRDSRGGRIDGATSLSLASGAVARLVWSGSAWSSL